MSGADGRIRALDGLRGIAALMVCLSHLIAMTPTPEASESFSRNFQLIGRRLDGSACVDFFFVLSGFVLALPYVGRDPRPLRLDRFVLRRILRIMPVYWIGILAAFVLRRWLEPSWEILGNAPTMGVNWTWPVSPRDLVEHAGLVFGVNNLLVNGPIWTLAVEMQMSMLLPFVIAALRPPLEKRVGLLVLLLSVLIPLFWRSAVDLRFLPLFVLGAWLAAWREDLLERVRGPVLLRALLGAVSLGLLFNRAWLFWDASPDPRPEYISALGAAGVVVLAFSREGPGLLGWRPIRFLGEISYSFYLMHLPLVLAAQILLRGRGVSEGAVFAGALLSALGGSTLLYLAVERPLLNWMRSLPRD